MPQPLGLNLSALQFFFLGTKEADFQAEQLTRCSTMLVLSFRVKIHESTVTFKEKNLSIIVSLGEYDKKMKYFPKKQRNLVFRVRLLKLMAILDMSIILLYT